MDPGPTSFTNFSRLPSLAKLGVSAFLLIVLLGTGGLMPGWIAIAQTKATVGEEGTLPAALSGAKFEVASIKPRENGGLGIIQTIKNPASDGRFYATDISVRELIEIAYGIPQGQITGGPRWINVDRFAIRAKADAGVNKALGKLSPERGRLIKERMVRALLVSRFKLKVHHETRILPVYDLVIAKNGPKLQKAKPNGSDTTQRSGRPVKYRFRGTYQELSVQGETIKTLVAFLTGSVGRPVLDRTGLSGKYNFTLKCAPFSIPNPATSLHSAWPSVFTAVRRQLGLKLKPGKGPVPIIVIDHIEPPTPN